MARQNKRMMVSGQQDHLAKRKRSIMKMHQKQKEKRKNVKFLQADTNLRVSLPFRSMESI
jgi:hypothetical protein